MTSALKMSEQLLMLNKLEITKSNKTESRSIVEIEIKIKLAYFKVTGKAFKGQNPVLNQGAISFMLTLPRWQWV